MRREGLRALAAHRAGIKRIILPERNKPDLEDIPREVRDELEFMIVSRLDEYYTPEEVRLWLYAPHPQLEGQRAIDFIVSERAEDVIAILDRLDAEAYL